MKQKTQNNFSQCSKCGARILWVQMKSGKKMPVNPQFVNFVADGGKDRLVLANGEVTSGTITTDPGKASGFGYMSQRNTAVSDEALFLHSGCHLDKEPLRSFLQGFPARSLYGILLCQMHPI